MEIIKCRTCLHLMYEDDSTSVTTRCYLKETVKQAILRLIPEMNLTLQDDDVVCKKCVNSLQTTLKFIEACLTVESLISYNKNISNTYIEVQEFDTKVEELEHILGQIDFDHNYYYKQTFMNRSNVSDEENDDKNNFDVDDSSILDEVKIDSSLTDDDAEENYYSTLVYETDDGEKEGNVDDSSLLGEDMKIESSLLDDTKRTGDTIDNIASPIKMAMGELSSTRQNDLEEGIPFELYYPEVIPKGEDLRCQEVMDCDPDFSCAICFAKFFDKEMFEEHMQSHTFLCEFCGEDFSDGREDELQAHVDEHKKFLKVCEFCGIIVQGAKSLRKHINTKHVSTSALYLCDRCPKSFSERYLVNAHIQGVHLKARQKQCPACGKFFVNLDSLKNHYRLVHLELKPFPCTICGKKFGRGDYLERHKARHGLKNVNKSRALTKRKGKRVPKHGVHLKDPGKPVKCNICGKEVATVHLLKGHLESHVKIRRYKCDYCGLTFSMLNNKKRHEKSHENNSENKYRCNICWKRMQTKEDLDHHVQSHDRPPQHACDICGEKFHRRYLLDNHVADKHISEGDVERAVEEIVIKNLLEYVNPNII